MPDTTDKAARAVPSGRFARFSALGKLAGGVAGGMVAEGARRLADGERPAMRDLLLTPANATRVADQLSNLRGAAMKMGQMISMDAGEMLPPELGTILSKLRDRAHHMPPQQLQAVLVADWGRDWRTRFQHFDARPIAAASIGQVHRATTKDGRVLAIKVQYPGVAASIDADVDNVSTLLRISGLMPKELDLAPLLAEAKRQLHEEADYLREGSQMARFTELLADAPDYVVPGFVPELTTPRILAMDYIEGVPIESLETGPQDVRDRAMRLLIDLVLRELFEFGAMQTDPNFANYRYQPDADGGEGGRLVLLDFGAARDVLPATANGYRKLLEALIAAKPNAAREAAIGAGFLGTAAVAAHRELVDRMIGVVIAEITKPGLFDFGDRAFVGVLREQAMDMAADRSTWHIPPMDTLFVQRKISGTALLAARLKAQVDVRELVGAVFQSSPAQSSPALRERTASEASQVRV